MSAKFTSYKSDVQAEMEKLKGACLEALGMEFTHHAVDNITQRGHVDTGRMRDSQTYQTDLDNSQVIVGNSANYAVFVELPGETRRWAGGNFMRDAMNDRQADYERVVKSILGDGFK